MVDMTILHLPLNVPGSEQLGQRKGFTQVFDKYSEFDYLKKAGELGNEGTNRLLIEWVDSIKPDIIWAQLQNTDTITTETWKIIREKHPDMWLTTWNGDARSEPLPYLIQYLNYFDIYYSATDQFDLYKPYCKRMEFMPIAVDPTEVTTFKEVQGVPDIVFIGNHYGDSFPNSAARYQLMAALTREFGNSFGVYGSGWPSGEVNLLGPVALKDQGSYYHAAKVVISMDHFKDMNYMSERRLWALASGTFTYIEKHPGIEQYFESGVHCGYFETAEELIAKIRKHQLLLEELPKDHWAHQETPLLESNAVKVVLNNHTWTQRAERVRSDYESRQI